MKNQALFSSKDKSKKSKCRLLQFLFGALRVSVASPESVPIHPSLRYILLWLNSSHHNCHHCCDH